MIVWAPGYARRVSRYEGQIGVAAGGPLAFQVYPSMFHRTLPPSITRWHALGTKLTPDKGQTDALSDVARDEHSTWRLFEVGC